MLDLNKVFVLRASFNSTKMCQRNELWANCLIREAGVPAEAELRYAQVGFTCNEPTADLVATVQPEQIYTAPNIWGRCNLEPRKSIPGSIPSFHPGVDAKRVVA